MTRLLVVGLIAAARMAAQTLEVYSEFQRVDPLGNIVSIDRTPKPREILSPGVARNAFASFHVVVRSPKTTSYFLLVDTYPKDVFQTALYKEEFVKCGDTWIPDVLKLLRPPNFGAIPDAEAGIPGQTASVYLLDVWVPPETPVSRVRLELQLKVGAWIIYPMEVRVLPALVPGGRNKSAEALPGVEQRADEAAMAPLRGFLEGRGTKAPSRPEPGAPRTLREAIRRNAEQDMALARASDQAVLLPAVKQKVADSNGGGEWYLSIRDLIYRMSGQ